MDIAFQHSKRDAPVSLDSDGPIPGKVTTQLMQTEAGHIDIFDATRFVQSYQNQSKLASVDHLDASVAAFMEEPLQPFVREALDHECIVTLGVTTNQRGDDVNAD